MDTARLQDGLLKLNCNVSDKTLAMFLSKILRAADHPYLEGVGGRKVDPLDENFIEHLYDLQANNKLSAMQGLTLKSLKHHVALQPLFLIMGGGMIFVCAYIGR